MLFLGQCWCAVVSSVTFSNFEKNPKNQFFFLNVQKNKKIQKLKKKNQKPTIFFFFLFFLNLKIYKQNPKNQKIQKIVHGLILEYIS